MSCVGDEPTGLFQFNDDECRKVLVTAYTSATGLPAPVDIDLAHCT